MSILRVSTIQDTAGSNSSTPAAIANGTAKAWVNFNGTGTVAIRASYNVSSITDNGVGDYTVNFTTAMVDANYCAALGGGFSNVYQNRVDSINKISATTTNIRVECAYSFSSIVNADFLHVDVAIFR